MNYGADLVLQTPEQGSDNPEESDCPFLSCNLWLLWISAVSQSDQLIVGESLGDAQSLCQVWSRRKLHKNHWNGPDCGIDFICVPVRLDQQRACVPCVLLCEFWRSQAAAAAAAPGPTANELTGEKGVVKSTWMRLTDKWHTWNTHRTLSHM